MSHILRRLSRRRTAAWAILVLFVLITLLPFYWMLRISLSNNRTLFANPGSLMPTDFTFGAFKRVLGIATLAEATAEGGSGANIDFWRYLANSVVTSAVITVCQVFFSAMAAYAFARLRWPGREKVFFVFLTALMIPPIFTALPNFVTVKQLGLLNTYAGIVLPYLFMTPFAVFFLRQFFLNISREVEEAAIVDGAGHAHIFFRLIVPMSSAPIATISLLVYIGAWNEYFWPLLVGQENDVRVLTVALGIFRAQSPQAGPDWSGLMAATLLAALPVIALFTVFGRWIVNSIQFSGIK
ncbi:carbohydrate ABC transporter permease [Microbispora cellulosiformans]|uniref:Carbohydrate ABC transporter permease n=1 Tax=Microbispora cellulosiformans TaxID=2614688 RepID=A0A5J5K1A8_9ACTN|nr:carbohydrate ABC transporter permease [Microbispora cellulosiformans]KAA9378162.1 carbohydrate ABC transporter permease [Microbispora cellulosiformans]